MYRALSDEEVIKNIRNTDKKVHFQNDEDVVTTALAHYASQLRDFEDVRWMVGHIAKEKELRDDLNDVARYCIMQEFKRIFDERKAT